VLTQVETKCLTKFLQFLKSEHGVPWQTNAASDPDLMAGRSCLRHACGADWLEWRQGSTLFFWRWPPPLRKEARDGHPIWVKGDLPSYRRPQRKEKDELIRWQVQQKLDSVRSKGYIVKGSVSSLTGYFAVPKGDNDIRLVYDATKLGLNAALWVPSFTLPGAELFLDLLSNTSSMADLDMGEMFLNFPLDIKVRPYCGLDLKPYFEHSGNFSWEMWVRCMMGMVSSPFICIKDALLADEVAKGGHQEVSNLFHWDSVIMNLPGSERYDPTKPWVYRVRCDREMASDVVTYVDDMRPVGHSRDACWKAGHVLACLYCWLGIQVSSRKTRPPSQTPGAWAGMVVSTGPEGVGVKCAQDKWDKAQRLLRELKVELDQSDMLDYKGLQQKRGFFVHVQRTYPCITPYLKGFHNMLDGWRENRDADGWKQPLTQEHLVWSDATDTWEFSQPTATKSHPEQVRAATRLASDLECLQALFSPATPPLRLARATSISVAAYGFVDASGAGFGSSILLLNGETIFCHGFWGSDEEQRSSNYRELRNLVDTLQEGLTQGDLQGTEVFLFTDNGVAEAAFYKGNSDNRFLFQLILRLRQLEMSGQLCLHVIHVSGTRMVAQGTDGLSRLDYTSGVMAGYNMMTYIPLHLSALERAPQLLPWVHSWLPDSISPLTPAQWYTLGHGVQGGSRAENGAWYPTLTDQTWFIWAPLPAAAAAAFHQLSLSRHKRSHLNHIFIAPRLMTAAWRKKLFKLADLVLELPAGANDTWPQPLHEPLILGLTLRFFSHPPWTLRNSPKVLAMGRQVRGMWGVSEGHGGPLLRQLCQLPALLDSMQPGLVWEVLHPPP